MKSEDPIYVLEHNLVIDVDWYLEHQLRGPIERIFDAVLSETALRNLFKGEHMNVKKVVVSKNTGIGRFVSKNLFEMQVSHRLGSRLQQLQAVRERLLHPDRDAGGVAAAAVLRAVVHLPALPEQSAPGDHLRQ